MKLVSGNNADIDEGKHFVAIRLIKSDGIYIENNE